MKRRDLLSLCIAGCGAAALRPAAGAAAVRPLFLHGAVTTLTWADPLPRLALLQREDAPQALRAWGVRARSPGFDSRVQQLLADAVVPPAVDGGRWIAVLPSLARLQVAELPRPYIGDVVGILGAWRPPLAGTPALDALVFLRAGRAWDLPPVGSQPTP